MLSPRRLLLSLLILLGASASWGSTEHRVLSDIEAAAYRQDFNSLESIMAELPSGYLRGHAAYRLAITHLNLGDKKRADQALEQALAELEPLIESAPDNAQIMAEMASVLGLRVAVKPWRAVSLADDSERLVQQALKTDPEHPLPLMIKGISLYNSPKFFGGDKNAALEYFEAAQQRYDEAEQHYWGEAENLYWLGLNHAALEKPFEAERFLSAALSMVPDFRQAAKALESLTHTQLSAAN